MIIQHDLLYIYIYIHICAQTQTPIHAHFLVFSELHQVFFSHCDTPEACWTMLDLSRLSCKSLFTWRSISWRQASRASTEGPSSNPVLVTGSGRLSWCAWHYGTKALIEHSNVAILYIYIYVYLFIYLFISYISVCVYLCAGFYNHICT